MLLNLLAVGLGGAIGAISRFFLAGWMQQKFPQFEPAGTLFVNVLGCFLIGLLVTLEMQGYLNQERFRAFAITGILGSLTTFSTFGYQSVVLARDQSFNWAFFNIASNLILGITAVLLGMLVGRLFDL